MDILTNYEYHDIAYWETGEYYNHENGYEFAFVVGENMYYDSGNQDLVMKIRNGVLYETGWDYNKFQTYELCRQATERDKEELKDLVDYVRKHHCEFV